MFKTGELVKCIDPGNKPQELTKDRDYTILFVPNSYCINIMNDKGELEEYANEYFNSSYITPENTINVRIGDIYENFRSYFRVYKILENRVLADMVSIEDLNVFMSNTVIFFAVLENYRKIDKVPVATKIQEVVTVFYVSKLDLEILDEAPKEVHRMLVSSQKDKFSDPIELFSRKEGILQTVEFNWETGKFE